MVVLEIDRAKKTERERENESELMGWGVGRGIRDKSVFKSGKILFKKYWQFKLEGGR